MKTCRNCCIVLNVISALSWAYCFLINNDIGVLISLGGMILTNGIILITDKKCK